MLATVGCETLDDLMEETVPSSIRLRSPLRIPEAVPEAALIRRLREIAAENEIWRSYLGMGYSGTITPGVIQRNILENPGWYTQYTPYQAEIAQGRLEALLNFQTTVIDLTGLEIANASLLDEATAAAEAMFMLYGMARRRGGRVFLVSEDCHPQTIGVVGTRAEPLGIEVKVGPAGDFVFGDDVFGALVQYPATGWRRARLRRALQGGARGGQPRGRCRGSDVAAAARAAGRLRCGCGSGQRPAVRGPDGVRRAARRLHRVPREVQAAAPRAHHRGVGGPARQPGPAHGAADARASTSGARRRPRTSAPRRSCWR